MPSASHRLAAAITAETRQPPFEVLDDFVSFYFDTALSGSPATNQRAMETLTDVGVADEIYAGPPPLRSGSCSP